MDILREITERLSIFINLYDDIRIVDPVKKLVLATNHEGCGVKSTVKGANCYEIWGRSGMCKNCVSYRAFSEKRSVSKFERNGDRLYWTLATPCDYEGQTYIVEFLKNITDEDYLVDQGFKTYMPLHSTVMTLNELANTDALTGVFNRRYIDQQLAIEVDKAKFHQEDLSILLFDIDYFKRVNDTYGHLVGDQVLIQFTEMVLANLRQDVDWIGRYGGEEFLVVLNRTSLPEAAIVAERIRGYIERSSYEIEGESLNITCSIGISASEKGIVPPEVLIKKADECLYLAKVSGRNQIKVK